MKRILVTGVAGFIGSNLVKTLLLSFIWVIVETALIISFCLLGSKLIQHYPVLNSYLLGGRKNIKFSLFDNL